MAILANPFLSARLLGQRTQKFSVSSRAQATAPFSSRACALFSNQTLRSRSPPTVAKAGSCKRGFIFSLRRQVFFTEKKTIGIFPRRMSRLCASSGGDETAKKALVAIGNGSEEMEAVIAVDVLRRAGIDVRLLSVEENLEINASRGVKIIADGLINSVAGVDGGNSNNFERFDLVILPGGMPGSERLRDSEILRRLVEEHLSDGRNVAAICAAPVVALQSWGILQDLVATAHPAFSGKLLDQSKANERVVTDGLVTTSRGPGTAFEFALELVSKLAGPEKAADVAGPMVMAKGDGSDVFRVTRGRESLEESRVKASISSRPPSVLVPIVDGTEEMEAVILIDVLRRAGADVVVASINHDLEVKASRKVCLAADVALADVASQEFDLVALPGGMPGASNLRDDPVLDKILRRQFSEGKLCAAICASPVVVLKSKGLLEGFQATAHPAFSGELLDQTTVPARVVVDRNLVTSRGPGTAFEFSLTLVEILFGSEKAAEVAKPMVLPEYLVYAPA